MAAKMAEMTSTDELKMFVRFHIRFPMRKSVTQFALFISMLVIFADLTFVTYALRMAKSRSGSC